MYKSQSDVTSTCKEVYSGLSSHHNNTSVQSLGTYESQQGLSQLLFFYA